MSSVNWNKNNAKRSFITSEGNIAEKKFNSVYNFGAHSRDLRSSFMKHTIPKVKNKRQRLKKKYF